MLHILSPSGHMLFHLNVRRGSSGCRGTLNESRMHRRRYAREQVDVAGVHWARHAGVDMKTQAVVRDRGESWQGSAIDRQP